MKIQVKDLNNNNKIKENNWNETFAKELYKHFKNNIDKKEDNEILDLEEKRTYSVSFYYYIMINKQGEPKIDKVEIRHIVDYEDNDNIFYDFSSLKELLECKKSAKELANELPWKEYLESNNYEDFEITKNETIENLNEDNEELLLNINNTYYIFKIEDKLYHSIYNKLEDNYGNKQFFEVSKEINIEELKKIIEELKKLYNGENLQSFLENHFDIVIYKGDLEELEIKGKLVEEQEENQDNSISLS